METNAIVFTGYGLPRDVAKRLVEKGPEAVKLFEEVMKLLIWEEIKKGNKK